MQIKPAIEAATPYTPTKTDTLQKAIQAMQIKIDSLEKVVAKTEVGQTFFSDINGTMQTSFASYTALQLTIFSLLITVAGYFSWRWLVTKLTIIRNQAKSYTDTNIYNLEQKHEKIDTSIYTISFDVARSMFLITENGNKQFCYGWAIKAAAYATGAEYNKEESIITWLENAKESIRHLTYKNEYHLKNQHIIDGFFKIIYDFGNEDISKMLDEIKALYYEKIYTP